MGVYKQPHIGYVWSRLKRRGCKTMKPRAYSCIRMSTDLQFLAAVKAGSVARGSYLLVESLDRLSREKILRAHTVVRRRLRVSWTDDRL